MKNYFSKKNYFLANKLKLNSVYVGYCITSSYYYYFIIIIIIIIIEEGNHYFLDYFLIFFLNFDF
jgi:hypothetical protein